MKNPQVIASKIGDVVAGVAIAVLLLIFFDFFDACAAEEVCGSMPVDQDFEDLVAIGYKKSTGRNPINVRYKIAVLIFPEFFARKIYDR